MWELHPAISIRPREIPFPKREIGHLANKPPFLCERLRVIVVLDKIKPLRGFFAIMVALWLALLFVQRGNCDENEHAHIAWLMGELGQRPLVDFFQHHMPLLWDVLKIYFLIGLDGPEVLYFGHLLVVLSMLTLVLGFWALARSLATRPVNAEYATALATTSFVGWCLMETYAVQLRPESLAAAAWVLSCVAWRWGDRRADARWCLASGVLFSLAFLFTPRVVILSGWLILLSERRIQARQVLVWLGGAGGTALLYLLLSGISPGYLSFAISYSALLQKVGSFDPGPSLARLPWIKMALLQTGLWICVARVTSPLLRSKFWIHLGYLAFTVVAGLVSCWPHVYMQNFIVSYLSMAMSLLVLASRADWDACRVSERLASLVPAVLAVAVVVEIASCLERGTIISDVRFRRALMEGMASSDTVLLAYPLHPIVVRDASYYGPWLFDSPNRMAEGVALVRERYGLPPCNYLEDLKSMAPRLIDSTLPMAVGPTQQAELQAVMASRYAPLDWTRVYDPTMVVLERQGVRGR